MDEQLFYDSELEALRDDVNACGGPKTVGGWFWPEKTPEARRNRVNDCLNSERGERFSDEQRRLVVRKAREARGFSAWLYFTCDDTGFERPKPRHPKDEQVELLAREERLLHELKALMDRRERLVRAPISLVGKTG